MSWQRWLWVPNSEFQQCRSRSDDSKQNGELYEPTHEIMALIALRKLNLQTRMRSNPLGLHIWFLVWPFVYFHTLCVRTAKAQARLRICANSKGSSVSSITLWNLFHLHDPNITFRVNVNDNVKCSKGDAHKFVQSRKRQSPSFMKMRFQSTKLPHNWKVPVSCQYYL